jgi:hypothetical protein
VIGRSLAGGRFELRRELGAGGGGVVYEAFDRDARAVVALKVLRGVSAGSLVRLRDDFPALARLDHPNLCALRDPFFDETPPFFTMALVPGVELLEWVRPHGGDLDEARLRAALRQTVAAIAAIHAAGKLHRDVKPANVRVADDGRVVLLDYGLVVDASSSVSEGTLVAGGTPAYMSPEQASSDPLDAASDWYSFGILLYEALTGRLPFDGDDEAQMQARLRYEPAPPRAVARVPDDLDALCVDLLRRAPDARPTAEQIARRLETPTRAVRAATPSTSPVFLGRHQELAALERALTSSRQEAVLVLVRGGSGLGKSALVRTSLAALRERHGAIALEGRCFERELAPFQAFDGCLHGLASALGDLPATARLGEPARAAIGRLFPYLRRVGALRSAAESIAEMSAQEVRAAAFVAFRELVAALAAEHPIAIAFDDFQWIDQDSLDLLREVLEPPDAPRVLVVAAVRTDTAADRTTAALAHLHATTVTIDLAPLGTRDAAELTRHIAGSGGLDVDAIVREARGHPLMLQELVRFATRHASRPPASLGALSLDEAVWSRVAELDAVARDLLETIAVAGTPVSVDVASLAAGVSRSEGARWATLLTTSFFARATTLGADDAIETYHDRIRETVLAHLTPEVRARRHRGLADALEATGREADDPQTLVRHLEAAGELKRAASLARTAARAARASLAFDRAADLLRVSLRLGVNEAEQRTVRLELAEVLLAGGRGGPAADEFLAAAEASEGEARRVCLRRAAQQLIRTGEVQRGLDVFRLVLGEVGASLPATPTSALASLLWHRTKLSMRGLSWPDAPRGTDRDGERFEVFQAIATSLGYVDFIRGADFQARALDLALRTGRPEHVGYALTAEAITLATRGRRHSKRVAEAVRSAHKIADERKSPFLRGMAVMGEATERYFVGEFAEAIRLLDRADATFQTETTGTAYESATVRLMRFWALRHVGDLVTMRQAFGDYVRDAARRGDDYFETTLCRSGNLVWLALDDPQSAERDLERKHWASQANAFTLQHWFFLRARAEIDLYVGDVEKAKERAAPGLRDLQRSMLLRVETVRVDCQWLVAKLDLAIAAARPADAREAVANAAKRARELAKSGIPCAAAWGKLVEAAVAVRREQAGEARALLTQAAEAGDRCGLLLVPAVARFRLAQMAGGPQGVAAALTVMNALGARDPMRLADVVAPGFGRGAGT